jgi:hypothetical protein
VVWACDGRRLYGWGDNTTANLGLENTPAPGPARRRCTATWVDVSRSVGSVTCGAIRSRSPRRRAAAPPLSVTVLAEPSALRGKAKGATWRVAVVSHTAYPSCRTQPRAVRVHRASVRCPPTRWDSLADLPTGTGAAWARRPKTGRMAAYQSHAMTV